MQEAARQKKCSLCIPYLHAIEAYANLLVALSLCRGLSNDYSLAQRAEMLELDATLLT